MDNRRLISCDVIVGFRVYLLYRNASIRPSSMLTIRGWQTWTDFLSNYEINPMTLNVSKMNVATVWKGGRGCDCTLHLVTNIIYMSCLPCTMYIQWVVLYCKVANMITSWKEIPKCGQNQNDIQLKKISMGNENPAHTTLAFAVIWSNCVLTHSCCTCGRVTFVNVNTLCRWITSEK